MPFHKALGRGNSAGGALGVSGSRTSPLIEQVCNQHRDGLGATTRGNLEELGAHACRDDRAPLEFGDGRVGLVFD